MIELTKQNITKSISINNNGNILTKTFIRTFDNSHLTTPYEYFSIIATKDNVSQITVFEKQTFEILSITVVVNYPN